MGEGGKSIRFERALGTSLYPMAVLLVVSKDGGATWNSTPIPGVVTTVNSTGIAIVDGTAHVALASTESEAYYLTGPVDNVSSWKRQNLPAAAGWKRAENANVGLTIDAGGKPVIAWYEAQNDGDERRFQVWRPGGQVVTAVDTKKSADNADLAIAAGAGKIGLLFETPLDEKDEDHGVWYTQSADGASWSKPAKLPIDGPRGTNPPLDVAMDSHGRIVAVFGANSGSDTTSCNYPALSRSSDGTTWKTCGPGKAEGGDFSPQPATLHVVEAGNDKAYVLWQEPGDNKYQTGMLVWHER